MFTTTLKLIFRNWWRNKTFTLIALLSLTVGIACTNLLGAFVTYEQGIERSNPNGNRMVWAMQDLPSNSGKKVAYMQKGVPGQIKDKYPKVEDFLQLNDVMVKYTEVDNRRFEPMVIVNVTASFPEFFPFELLYGSWNAFHNPQSMILHEKQARRLFGNENAVGKQIIVCETDFDAEKRMTYTIGAVVKDRPQSAVIFDGLICNPETMWGGPTLFMMPENTDLDQFEEKVKADGIPTLNGGQYYFTTLDNSLSPRYNQEQFRFWHHRKDSLLAVGLISAILVFLIAVFNYVNMSFSRVLQQVKTIHTQKLMGATFKDIRLQLFGDTFLIVLIAFILALLLMYDLLPIFRQVVATGFTSAFFYDRDFFPFLILFVAVLAVIPAWMISRKISRLSENDYRMFFVKSKNRWTGIFVVIQCTVAIALVTGTIIANNQVNLVKQSGSRFCNVIEIGSMIHKQDLKLLKPRIESVSGISDISMGNMALLSAWIMHGRLIKENGDEIQTMILRLSGDDGFIRVLQLDQIAGELWETLPEKYPESVFVNASFADIVGKTVPELIGQPLRKYFDTNDSHSVIAGVIDDFYFDSLEEKVMAVVIERQASLTETYTTMQIRLDGKRNDEAIAAIRSAWQRIYPDEYFTYTDMHGIFMKRNHKVFEMSELLRMYSLISILLTCFGLFGISFYAVRQHTKEIGIRKINGAKTYQILWLLLKPVFVWIAIGFAIGVPLAWWLMERWLQQFAYRVDISLLSCLAALAIVTLVSVVTVIWHTWRMARANPVKSLRSE